MALTQQQIDTQKKDVEEMLGEELARLGFAKRLFFGQFKGNLLFPYPDGYRPATMPLPGDDE